MTLSVASALYFYDKAVNNQGLDFIMYSAFLNGPILVFALPFLFYLDDLSTYIAKTRPDLYNNNSSIFPFLASNDSL